MNTAAQRNIKAWRKTLKQLKSAKRKVHAENIANMKIKISTLEVKESRLDPGVK